MRMFLTVIFRCVLLALIVHVSTSSANASPSIICKNKKSGALQVESRCSSKEVRLNASMLPIQPGQIGISTCRDVEQRFIDIVTNANRSGAEENVSCASNEFALFGTKEIDQQYSSDFAEGSSTQDAGQTLVGSPYPIEFNFTTNSGLVFPIGYEFGGSSNLFPEVATITGTYTRTTIVQLTCCKLAD